jgi:hypothetical protein
MRDALRDETRTETTALGVIALCCYSATLAAMFALGYSALALALRAAGPDFAALLSTAGA